VPLTQDQKNDVAHRLLAGEDVELQTDEVEVELGAAEPDGVPVAAVCDRLAQQVAQQAIRIAVLEAQLMGR
jgi:hypothetical protein